MGGISQNSNPFDRPSISTGGVSPFEPEHAKTLSGTQQLQPSSNAVMDATVQGANPSGPAAEAQGASGQPVSSETIPKQKQAEAERTMSKTALQHIGSAIKSFGTTYVAGLKAIGGGIGSLGSSAAGLVASSATAVYNKVQAALTQNTKAAESPPEPAAAPAKPVKRLECSSNEIKGFSEARDIAPAGRTTITLMGDAHKGEPPLPLVLTGPIKLLPNMQTRDDKPASAGLIMNQTDFETIKNAIHANAFGEDFAYLNDGTVVIWKLPADINGIESLRITEPIKVAVGTYIAPRDGEVVDGLPPMTKYRIDFPKTEGQNGSRPSIHCLEGGGKRIPAFSMGALFSDFNNISPQDRENATKMIESLAKLGIHAYSCQMHHLFVFSTGPLDEKPLTPESFAEKLKDNKNEIVAALKCGTTDPAKQAAIEAWADAFIAHYGPKKE